jgi:hypothetical protein
MISRHFQDVSGNENLILSTAPIFRIAHCGIAKERGVTHPFPYFQLRAADKDTHIQCAFVAAQLAKVKD